MDNLTRQIGETFRLTERHPGLPDTTTILEVVESDCCQECYIKNSCSSRNSPKGITGYCSKDYRSDNKSVIFKKIEED